MQGCRSPGNGEEDPSSRAGSAARAEGLHLLPRTLPVPQRCSLPRSGSQWEWCPSTPAGSRRSGKRQGHHVHKGAWHPPQSRAVLGLPAQRRPREAPTDQAATSALELGFLRRTCKERGFCVYSFSGTNHPKLVPPHVFWDILITAVREASRFFCFPPPPRSQLGGPTLRMSHCMMPR